MTAKQSNYTLAAGTSITIANPASTWLSLLLTNKSLSVQFDQNPPITMYRGDVYRQPFDVVTITNTQPAVSVSFTIDIGDGKPPVLTGNRVPQAFTHKVDVPCGAGAVTQIVTGLSNTRYVYLTIAAGAAGPVRIGGTNVSASAGVWLLVGLNAFTIETTGDIYVWNPQASSVTVAIATGG